MWNNSAELSISSNNVKHDSLHPAGDRVVSSRDPGHNHTGNVSIARTRKAVREMKNKITDLTVAPSSPQAAVMSPTGQHSDGPAKASDSVQNPSTT